MFTSNPFTASGSVSVGYKKGHQLNKNTKVSTESLRREKRS